MTSAAAELPDELVREARARYERARLDTRARAVFAGGGLAAAFAIAAAAYLVHGGPGLSLPRAAFFTVLYAVV